MSEDEKAEPEEPAEPLSSAINSYLMVAEIMRDKFLSYKGSGFSESQALFITCWEFFGVKLAA